MILTVTPNPALDVSYRLSLRRGESHRVDAPVKRAGGKGINVARVLHATGREVLALAPCGGPTGAEFRAELETAGVPHRLLPVRAETRRSIALIDGGEATLLNERGERIEPGEADALLAAAADELQSADLLVASGSLPPGADDDLYARLVAAAHAAGVPCLVDAVGAALTAAARAGADVVKPNREELAATTGTDDPITGARVLCEAGARLVLVSLGAEGMLAVPADGSAPLRARLPEPLTGNPTGAGDAAVAALAAGIVEGVRDTRALLAAATAWSAAAVLAPVAGELGADPDALADRLRITAEDRSQP